MIESNAQFLARMKEITTLYENPQQLPPGSFMRLIALAEERVMIEEHALDVSACFTSRGELDSWIVFPPDYLPEEAADLSTALRSVVAKIGEGK